MKGAGVPAERNGGLPTNFDPQEAKNQQAKVDALIEYAAKVRDFTLLERAVEEKVNQQEEFIGWWRANVTPGKGGDRVSKVAERRLWLTADEAEKRSQISKQQVSRWGARLKKRDAYIASLVDTAYKKAMGQTSLGQSRAGVLTRDPEWYTPPEYIEAARRTMGGIDLDPASNDFANQTVRADTIFDDKDDGLEKAWFGRVFLNPPYSHPAVERFVVRLVESYAVDEIEAAVLLTNNATDTAWWHKAATVANGICFTRGRISFYQRDGQKSSPTHGQTFFYFGSDMDAFAGEFSAFGLIR